MLNECLAPQVSLLLDIWSCYIVCTACLLCLPGPVFAAPCDSMYRVTMKVVSAPLSPGKIPARLLHQANKVFSDYALWFVDFPCYEHKAPCDMSHLGETELDVWL